MHKYLLIAAMFVGSAVITPTVLTKFADERDAQSDQQRSANGVTSNKVIKKAKKHNVAFSSGRSHSIDANRVGQFHTEAKLNGRRMEVLVDTGATYVALNASTAKRMGIRLKKKDFKHEVQTANGRTYVAVAKIDEVKIGRIVIEDVLATVSENDRLETVLLGMSFLNKLDKFTIEDNTLYMKQ